MVAFVSAVALLLAACASSPRGSPTGTRGPVSPADTSRGGSAGAVPDADGTRGARCERWVAPDGDDDDAGTRSRPWASLQHAADRAPDRGCTVWFEDGLYGDANDLERAFDRRVTFRAVHPYRAILEGPSALVITGGSNMTFVGFQFRHPGPDAGPIVVYVADSDTHHITFRNDIFHDSYNNDILKILDGARSITVRDSVFYNQADGEQHIDVNSVHNVRIEGNVFFNDFAASGRDQPDDTKHYIVVKDSNEDDDGIVGSEHITIARNIFMSWQGGLETFVQIGNDGKDYFEARDVRVENNLMLGNGDDELHAAFGVSGARDVAFVNNTVVGDLPSSSFAAHVDIKDANPDNENVVLSNNIWSDPTATMGEFAAGDPDHTDGLVLDTNLYWNGGDPIPGGELLSPRSDDANRVVRNPRLEPDQDDVVEPVWTGSSFESGSRTIREEFARLVRRYGAIPGTSPAVGRAVRTLAPVLDIMGHRRDGHPDLGAYEA